MMKYLYKQTLEWRNNKPTFIYRLVHLNAFHSGTFVYQKLLLENEKEVEIDREVKKEVSNWFAIICVYYSGMLEPFSSEINFWSIFYSNKNNSWVYSLSQTNWNTVANYRCRMQRRQCGTLNAFEIQKTLSCLA